MSSTRFFPWHGGLPEQVPLSDGHAAHSTGGRSRGRKAEEQHLFAPLSLDRTSREVRLQLQTGLEGALLGGSEVSVAGFPVTHIVLGPVASFVCGHGRRLHTHASLSYLPFADPRSTYRISSRARGGREARRRRRGLAVAECDGERTYHMTHGTSEVQH